jgi:hypothetical protein
MNTGIIDQQHKDNTIIIQNTESEHNTSNVTIHIYDPNAIISNGILKFEEDLPDIDIINNGSNNCRTIINYHIHLNEIENENGILLPCNYEYPFEEQEEKPEECKKEIPDNNLWTNTIKETVNNNSIFSVLIEIKYKTITTFLKAIYNKKNRELILEQKQNGKISKIETKRNVKECKVIKYILSEIKKIIKSHH